MQRQDWLTDYAVLRLVRSYRGWAAQARPAARHHRSTSNGCACPRHHGNSWHVPASHEQRRIVGAVDGIERGCEPADPRPRQDASRPAAHPSGGGQPQHQLSARPCSRTPHPSRAQAAACAGACSAMHCPRVAPTFDRSTVSVVIPCLDEEAAIGACVAAVLVHGVGEVIVVDGGSADRTVERASAAGARGRHPCVSRSSSAIGRSTGSRPSLG
jgi:hypothetical protein